MGTSLSLVGKNICFQTVLNEYEGLPLAATVLIHEQPFLMVYHDVGMHEGSCTNMMFLMPIDHQALDAFANANIHAVDLMSFYYSAVLIHIGDNTNTIVHQSSVEASMYLWDVHQKELILAAPAHPHKRVVYPALVNTGIDLEVCSQSSELCYQFPRLVIDGIVFESEKIHQPVGKAPDSHAGKIHAWYQLKREGTPLPDSLTMWEPFTIRVGVTLFDEAFANVVAVQLCR